MNSACSEGVALSAPSPVGGKPATATAGNERKGEAINAKVFVGNLNFETTAEQLHDLFSDCGEIVQVVIPTDRMSGRPRGFAFVEFSAPEHAAEAIRRLDGLDLDGRRLRVNEAGERPASASPRSFASPDRPPRRPSRPKGSRRNARARKRSIW